MKTIWWEDGQVVLINQRKLPGQLEYIRCEDYLRVVKAIKTLEIRGAPAIGVAAAMGLALAVFKSKARNRTQLLEDLNIAAKTLRSTRPTAHNLFWVIDRVLRKSQVIEGSIVDIKENIVKEALVIAEDDIKTNKMLGTCGEVLLKNGDTVGTICNAGWLATAGEYGTALGVIKIAHEQGKKISVIALETRPVLQGARLTAFELKQDGIPVRVISDGAIGYCFARGLIDKFICGADRIIVSSGGHVVNKVGTNMVSIVAKYYNVPFYVAAPLSTFDFHSSLDKVIIEERDSKEVAEINNIPIIPEGVPVLNPAFDITPPEMINAIITEKGIIYKPFKDNIQKIVKN